MDPEPARSPKARAVFALGLVALLTGPFVGGVIPATVALLLARQTVRRGVRGGRLPDRLRVGPARPQAGLGGHRPGPDRAGGRRDRRAAACGRHTGPRTSTPTPTEPASPTSGPGCGSTTVRVTCSKTWRSNRATASPPPADPAYRARSCIRPACRSPRPPVPPPPADGQWKPARVDPVAGTEFGLVQLEVAAGHLRPGHRLADRRHRLDRWSRCWCSASAWPARRTAGAAGWPARSPCSRC